MEALLGLLVILGALAVAWWAVRGSRKSERRKLAGGASASTDSGQPIWLEGDGEFLFPVVGESHYQDELEAICGPKCPDGHEKKVTAELSPEPNNPHDKMAIAVLVAGRTVGYLSRDAARAYRQKMKALGLDGRPAKCKALITGGWKRSGRGKASEGSFGISLDLA